MKKPVPHDVVPFMNFDEMMLKELVPQGKVVNFKKGTVILREGDMSSSLYVILSGYVKAYISDENGKEFTLGFIEPGDYFGEVAMDGGPRSASITTVDTCRLFVIPKADVKILIERHPDFSRDLIGRLIRKIRNLADSVHNLALMNTYYRLAKFITENATKDADGRTITRRMTQQDIAAHIGVSREMISRIISDLTNCGYIVIENKRIIVLRDLLTN
jgi:CRP/FNR family cyclic AMP-dependent transcriptional regulator